MISAEASGFSPLRSHCLISAIVLFLYLLTAPSLFERRLSIIDVSRVMSHIESVDDMSACVKGEELKKKGSRMRKVHHDIHWFSAVNLEMPSEGTEVTLWLCWGANDASRFDS